MRPVGEKWGWIGQLHRRTDAALGYGLRPREATSGKEGAPIWISIVEFSTDQVRAAERRV